MIVAIVINEFRQIIFYGHKLKSPKAKTNKIEIPISSL